jgi:hypothetical protein
LSLQKDLLRGSIGSLLLLSHACMVRSGHLLNITHLFWSKFMAARQCMYRAANERSPV